MFSKHGFRVVKIVGKPIMFMSRPETEAIFKDQIEVQKVLDIEFHFCEEPSIVGYGGHLHVVAQKKASPSKR